MKRVALALWGLLIANLSADEGSSMLEEAKEFSRQFAQEVSQLPPPPRARQTNEILQNGSVWLIVDLLQTPNTPTKSALAYWSSNDLWNLLTEMGFNTLYLKGLKSSQSAGDLSTRTHLSLDPRWGKENEYMELAQLAKNRQLFFVGDLIRRSTGLSADFSWALKNRGDYPSLYQMVDIAPSDWSLLPPLPAETSFINIPWLSLQALEKRGYIPSEDSPYTKKSHWNSTGEIVGVDGRLHRWIYLKDFVNAPRLSWLAPSFTSEQIAAGDSLFSFYQLGQQIIDIDGSIPLHAQETIALWVRKLGGYSVEETKGGIASLKSLRSDFAYDTLTRAALLHALLTEDAELLQLIYRLLLKEEIQPMNLVHLLQPLNQFTCEWTEFLLHPETKFRYQEEMITGALLQQRLLRADFEKLGPKEVIPFSTWAGLCASALNISDCKEGKAKIQEAHLLLAFFYAMQPGIFALSPADLLGALPSNTPGTLDLIGSTSTVPTLYSSLSLQLQMNNSFAATIRKLTTLRTASAIAQAELLDIPATKNQSLLLLVHKLPNGLTQWTAINFGQKPIQESIDSPQLIKTAAINLVTGLQEPKVFSSASFLLDLPALSAKALIFQPKLFPDAPGAPPSITP